MFRGIIGAKEFIPGVNFKFGVVMTTQVVNLGVIEGGHGMSQWFFN